MSGGFDSDLGRKVVIAICVFCLMGIAGIGVTTWNNERVKQERISAYRAEHPLIAARAVNYDELLDGATSIHYGGGEVLMNWEGNTNHWSVQQSISEVGRTVSGQPYVVLDPVLLNHVAVVPGPTILKLGEPVPVYRDDMKKNNQMMKDNVNPSQHTPIGTVTLIQLYVNQRYGSQEVEIALKLDKSDIQE